MADFEPKPKRSTYARAVAMAFEAVRCQPADQIRWLGAQPCAGAWRLPVLNEAFDVDLVGAELRTAGGTDVSEAWAVLALHYLSVGSRPETLAPEVAFADLPGGRNYAGVYEQRAVRRLCVFFGSNGDALRRSAIGLGAQPAAGGDAAFDFPVFPRVWVRLVWHAPSDEFPPAATWLLPPNLEAWFTTEDIVVLSERLASRLVGRPF
ncbi:MAG: DUF3786 domain-containing protein [Thermoguttaceae bacterium]|jgi:hypothetical protein|nr:DUF3786 domain-containing protein [Thermoguttaceae bacterium]